MIRHLAPTCGLGFETWEGLASSQETDAASTYAGKPTPPRGAAVVEGNTHRVGRPESRVLEAASGHVELVPTLARVPAIGTRKLIPHIPVEAVELEHATRLPRDVDG